MGWFNTGSQIVKSLLIIVFMVLLPLVVSAQGVGGQVRRPERKPQTTTKPATKKRPTPKKQNEQKPVEQQSVDQEQETIPVEEAGYDVTISCNVPSATMYIDGNINGTASGSRFLKTGTHTVKLTSEDYEPLTETIQVNSSSRSFSFTMKKKESQLPEVLQNLVNNMVRVEGGSFTMGATYEQDNEYYIDEKPIHNVTIFTFFIGKYEVTQEEWQAVMGNNPSSAKGARRPVENVSWNDCQEFIRKLNNMTGKQFRLPTEAEWEYAARGGNKSDGYKYAGGSNLDRVAWYDLNSVNSSSDVGQKVPNELGLYDMSGNVWEWCQDRYGNYSDDSQTNPTGPSIGTDRVYRGGGWYSVAGYCRVSCRSAIDPGKSDNRLGLRLAF